MTDEAIGREIRQLRDDIKDDLGEIKGELGKLLPREVYTARHEALTRRVESLEREAELAETRQTATRRWMVSAVVIPLVSMTVMIILAVT
ncbi:hypothetical protein [Glycomyces tenuis]|uniref:hypothetical protein n=1 Tax=Glycomyces tenuis TaxID=58116 RepID=UPI0004155F7D|nr:hypothetical protein [Glycomyces tenuis]